MHIHAPVGNFVRVPGLEKRGLTSNFGDTPPHCFVTDRGVSESYLAS